MNRCGVGFILSIAGLLFADNHQSLMEHQILVFDVFRALC
jgi:hypothetical protein